MDCQRDSVPPKAGSRDTAAMKLAKYLVLATWCIGTTAATQSRRVHDQISPLVDGWFQSSVARKFWGQRMRAASASRVPVSIRMRSETAAISLARQATTPDLEVRRRYKNFLTAVITQPGASRLAKNPDVLRVELDVAPPTPAPLRETAQVIGAELSRLRGMNNTDLDGTGVVVADIDTGIDVFHPMMFNADGSYYSWIDTDGNGRFDPFIDAVDMNHNDAADAGETAGYWEGVAWAFGQPILETNNGSYTPGIDHLYVDENGDFTRNFGPAEGFTDSKPTFGEQLLVADDVNGNGIVDRDEKLIALGTSKIGAVHSSGLIFERGTDLSQVAGHDDSSGSHGTGVAGILAGGQPGHSQYTGIAPGVELLVAAYQQTLSVSFLEMLMWAIGRGADIVLHEYAPWVGYHRDGSSNLEQMMNASAADGVAHVNPTGNLGGSKKHALLEIAPSSGAAVEVNIPTGGFQLASMSIAWRRPERDLNVTLSTPGGEIVDLGINGSGATTLVDGTGIFAMRDISPGGTARYDVTLFHDGVALETGSWDLAIDDVTGGTGNTEVAVYVQDDISGWGLGVQFSDLDVSEKYLVGFPATADSAISVAAFTGRDDGPFGMFQAETAGQLRRYSCRGTRIDGTSVMDIAAPDNALSPSNVAPGFSPGAYQIFGGTSGAGPHVAGAAALIKQLLPDATGLEVRDAIRAGAVTDSDVVATDEHDVADVWGAGKLNVYRSLFAEDALAPSPPVIDASPVTIAAGQQNVLAAISVSDSQDSADSLLVYVDTNYDGSWDLGPEPATGELLFEFVEFTEHVMKIEVRDSDGQRTASLLRISVTEATGGGCGCRTNESAGWPLLFGLAFLLAVRRRKR